MVAQHEKDEDDHEEEVKAVFFLCGVEEGLHKSLGLRV